VPTLTLRFTTDILVSRDSRSRLVVDDRGFPEIRLSNFEFLKRVKS